MWNIFLSLLLTLFSAYSKNNIYSLRLGQDMDFFSFVFLIVGLFTLLPAPSSSSRVHSCSQYPTICWPKSRGQGKLGGGPAHLYQPGGSGPPWRIHAVLRFEAASQQSLSPSAASFSLYRESENPMKTFVCRCFWIKSSIVFFLWALSFFSHREIPRFFILRLWDWTRWSILALCLSGSKTKTTKHKKQVPCRGL